MQTITGTDICMAAALLRKGELVAIPTETVYGLAANALDTDAVLRVYETKGRPTFNPLIVHVHDVGEFKKYAIEIPDIVYTIAKEFSPGPITFVLKKKSIIPDIVTGGGDTVALRIPGHPLTLKLLSELEFPLAAPSANLFGAISPVNAFHVKDQLDGKIPYILDGGNAMVGVESTVIYVNRDQIEILRDGGVTRESLREIIRDTSFQIQNRQHETKDSELRSPGQLRSHYAPRTLLVFGNMEELLMNYSAKKKALLLFEKRYEAENRCAEEILSSSGDMHEAARNLFSAMRRLDASGAEVILAERLPEYGLGIAINDRLERAGFNE